MARRSALPVLVAVLGLSLLTACGSTVAVGERTSAPERDLGGVGSSTADPLDATSGGVQGSTASGSGRVQPQPTSSYVPQAAQPGGAVAARTERLGRGTTIHIGIADSDVNTYAKTLGLQGIATGDETAQVNAVVSRINGRGGLLGRRIELVWFHADSEETLNRPAQAAQEACATWTQDHHVFAVVGPIGMPASRELLACLARTGTPLIGAASQWGLDAQPFFQELYDAFPLFVNIGSMVGETFYRIAIARLVARDFFEPWDTTTGARATGSVKPPVKIGLVVHDNPTGKRVVAAVTRELAKHGLKITDVAWLPDGVAEQTAAAQNAALRFRSDGITHELGTVALAFAEGQRYRPRYFIPFEPQVIAANVPAGQMNGAMSESYIPALDVKVDPGPPTPATTECLNLMRRAGQDTTSATARYVMESVCDGFFFLEAAAKARGSLVDLTSGFESLGSRFPSALTWGTNLGPGRHASAVWLRDAGYSADCSCFVYTSNRNHS
jgi:hypothetical protein